MIEAYEKSVGFTPSNETVELRNKLKEAQDKWKQLPSPPTYENYSAVAKNVTEYGGNEVLSNLFFYGFRTPIESTEHPFKSYSTQPFEPTELEASLENDDISLKFSTDDKGILREWSCEF
jgi:hypothetical protein